MTENDCPHCGGLLRAGVTSYTANRNGYHLSMDNVPVLICEQCHEPLFTEDAVRHIQKIVRTLDEQRRELDAIQMTP